MPSETEEANGLSAARTPDTHEKKEHNESSKDDCNGSVRDIESEGASQETQDPNLVEWDGPDDPESPLNWPSWKSTGHVVLASVAALFANITSTAFAPAAAELVEEFHVTNSTISALTVSIYLLGFAIGPLVIAPLSEHYGRLPVYIISIFITGIAGSGPNTVGGGTIADVIRPEKRGRAMGAFAVGPLLGPVIGPVTAGFVAQDLGWRWVFRILYIATATVTALIVLCMRETFGPLLLARKAARLRKETGNTALYTKFRQSNGSAATSLRTALQRPVKLLIFSPITLLLSLYAAFVFGLLNLLFTTFSSVFKGQYHFGPGVSGLSYLGLGFGMAAGVVIFSIVSDKVAKKAAAKGKAWKPEARLLLMVWFAPVITIGFFWYGWAAYYRTHWIVPIIGTSFIGIGALMIILDPLSTALSDLAGVIPYLGFFPWDSLLFLYYSTATVK
ncbi:Major facilitator superfamily [Macrophomina phaseolina MS6]|uniref:Major facilitator superfamily n=1 Tax=Macrophomina phaseolina (strain MS6) TaxID=1126212 RepID=K2RD92_MACPH|nr:Major facilitator superfamily [Macrophomina phaseolina MS6]